TLRHASHLRPAYFSTDSAHNADSVYTVPASLSTLLWLLLPRRSVDIVGYLRESASSADSGQTQSQGHVKEPSERGDRSEPSSGAGRRVIPAWGNAAGNNAGRNPRNIMP